MCPLPGSNASALSRADANLTRTRAFIKVNCDSLSNLLLQIAEVLPLRGDATRALRIIPPCHEPARFFVALDLKSDFFHYLCPLFHTLYYRRWIRYTPFTFALARSFLQVPTSLPRPPAVSTRPETLPSRIASDGPA